MIEKQIDFIKIFNGLIMTKKQVTPIILNNLENHDLVVEKPWYTNSQSQVLDQSFLLNQLNVLKI